MLKSLLWNSLVNEEVAHLTYRTINLLSPSHANCMEEEEGGNNEYGRLKMSVY